MRRPTSLFLTTIFLALSAVPIHAHAQKPPAPKTKTTLGTVQMPGDKGKVGTAYQLGAKGEELHFTLEKAEFATRFATTDDILLVGPKQRFLILTVAVQNPQKKDMLLFDQSFKFTVVSPDDQNFEEIEGMYQTARHDRLNMQLKPAQKVHALVAIPVYGAGPIAKLIVQRGDKTPVLRYELQDKVAALANSYAVSGALDAAEVGSAAIAAPFEIGPFDVTVEKVEDLQAAMAKFPVDAGQKLVAVTLTIKNTALQPRQMHYSILSPKLRTEDGDDMEWTFGILRMSADEDLNMSIDPGQQVRARMIFRAPAAAKPDTLILTELDSGRSVAVKLKS